MSTENNTFSKNLLFVGGGNMANAILGGLIQQGYPKDKIFVIEPHEPTRIALSQQWGINVHSSANPSLANVDLTIWAIKPQIFKEAAAQCLAFIHNSLHLSIAAGIPSSSIASWLGTERIVRAMPNTPALIGKGQTGLYARSGVTSAERSLVETILLPTGEVSWVSHEDLLDAVTAISGSGPAYVFFFIEAMIDAGIQMGLSADQAKQLSIGTFTGAAELARQSSDSPSVLRERVTSKGGTTFAAISSLQADAVDSLFKKALTAAQQRAKELGATFGQ
jgi:pyrroline-5-carboxylate reductase